MVHAVEVNGNCRFGQFTDVCALVSIEQLEVVMFRQLCVLVASISAFGHADSDG